MTAFPRAGGRRKIQAPCDPLFPDRWSPRAMSGEPVSRDELMVLFEAARWAPSSYNGQPWRFVYALRGTSAWERFFPLLVDFNRRWAGRAGALVIIVSRTTFERNGKPARTHAFDTGAAWENLALQGMLSGLVVHGMQGFDYDEARRVIGLPEDYEVIAMAAVGRPGRPEDLPEDLHEREAPSDRKPLDEIAFEASFEA